MNTAFACGLLVFLGASVVASPAAALAAAEASGRPGAIYEPGEHSGRVSGSGPIALGRGPQLFLDDFLIDSSEGVQRRPMAVERDPSVPNPLITGARGRDGKGPGDDNFQPFLSCLRDAETGLFRIWYGLAVDFSSSQVGYMESLDGIDWQRPYRRLRQPDDISFCFSIVDEGAAHVPQEERYKGAYFGRHGVGIRLAASADGLAWRPFAEGPRPTGDIVNLAYDSFRRAYVMTLKIDATPEDGYAGRSRTGGIRRMVGESTSADGRAWTPPWRIVMPGAKDEGITEFYGIGGVVNRGPMLVGMLKVLRDDLSCDPGGKIEGIGYTVVAWSHDGRTWMREREPFLDRDPDPIAWDHAHAWADVQLPVGDEMFIYYGGYKRGHKVNRFEERQIGLVRMKRDRYIAREAGAESGVLRTPLILLAGSRLTLNLEPKPGGKARVQIVGEDGKPVRGFAFSDCPPITADAVAAPVGWPAELNALKGRPARLEFKLTNARLFGFELQ